MRFFRAPRLLACTLFSLAACSDMTGPHAPSSPVFSQGSGGSGGGTTTPFINVSGVWNGSYTWLVANFGPINGPSLPRTIGPVTLREDAAGNITGSFCSPASLVCSVVSGKVANGLVEVNFGGFQFKGVPTTTSCPAGGTALRMSGPFRFSEGSGTWTLNRCP
jgi:hypothetical protein